MHANDLPICEGRDFEMARVKKRFRPFFKGPRLARCVNVVAKCDVFRNFRSFLEIPGTVAQRGLVLKTRFRTFFNGSCLARRPNSLAKCDEFPEFSLNY